MTVTKLRVTDTDFQNEHDYSISFYNYDIEYEGSPADIARFYCIVNGIKLFIMPTDDNKPDELSLYAEFTGSKGQVTDIAAFEDLPDLEQAYKLFFSEYLLKLSETERDYKLRRLVA